MSAITKSWYLSPMEAKLPVQSKSLFSAQSGGRDIIQKQRRSPLVALLTTSTEGLKSSTVCKDNTVLESVGGLKTNATTVYNDNWLELLAINHLSQSVQATTGFRNKKTGYDGLVEAARGASKNFNPTQQRQLVIEALEKAFPRPLLSMMRALLPQSKFTREYFAAFTSIFFAWLIGACEVRELDFNGGREKNVVHIKKCRFLEQSNCVGMCTNLCKLPSQIFIKESLGMPVNMVPDFDNMSCEMIFGQDPPEPDEDPALKQPCYKICKAKYKHSTNCSS